MNKKQYRQGDLLFVEVVETPPLTRRRDGVVIQTGEATGHSHRISSVDDAEIFEVDGGLFLSVGERGVSIVHEEHKPLSLPVGDYQVVRQREYSPEAIRLVRD